MNFEQDIKDSIEKNLPSAVGVMLKERLIKAEEDARKVVSLTSEIKSIRESNLELVADNKKVYDQLKAHESLTAREEAVTAREYRVDLYQANVQLDAAKATTQFVKEVALGLVRNVEYRNSSQESQSRTINTAPIGSYPNWTQGPTETKVTTFETIAK